MIATYHSNPSIDSCLESIAAFCPRPVQVILVDNGGTTLPQIDLDLVSICMPENVGFGRASNAGVQHAKYDMILLLNPDTVLFRDTLPIALSHLKSSTNPMIVGAVSLKSDGSINPSFKGPLLSLRHLLYLATGASRWLARREPRFELRSDEHLAGCFLLMHRAIWQRLGGFDERYFLFFEDADLRVRATLLGIDCQVAAEAKYRHDGGGIPRDDPWKIDCFARNGLRFLSQHWSFPRREVGQLLMIAWWGRRRCQALIDQWMKSLHTKGHHRP